MVKVTALEGAYIGSLTTTGTLPAVAMSAAEICVVNCVALTYVVGRTLPFH